MKFTIRTTFYALFLLLATYQAQAQPLFDDEKNAIIVGVNILDDSFTSHFKPIEIDLNWHFSNPFYFGYLRSVSEKFNLKAMLTFNNYKPGKLVDGAIVQASRKYVAFDVMT